MEKSEPSWRRLPLELRLQIMNILIEDHDAESCPLATKYVDPCSPASTDAECPLANYASVCREWQNVFEEATFARITITKKRLLEMEPILQYRQKLVKYIWLCIQFSPPRPPHFCHCYDTKQLADLFEADSPEEEAIVFTSTVHSFAKYLSTWETDNGLQLDIGIYLVPCRCGSHYID